LQAHRRHLDRLYAEIPFEPCIPSPGTKVPDSKSWIHELKHDGYRLIVQREGKRVRLFTATVTTGATDFLASSRPRCATGIRRS
jgi:hypothetical protein